MAVLIGAIAYRSLPVEEVDPQLRSWEMIRKHEGGQAEKPVKCPKCGEPYALIEGLDATDEILQGDLEFLAKALSSSHPFHPTRLFVRDPNGVLNRRFHLISPVNICTNGSQVRSENHSVPDVTPQTPTESRRTLLPYYPAQTNWSRERRRLQCQRDDS